MENTANRAIAVVGLGAILPDAPNVPAFWQNVKSGRYSITEVAPERWDPALYYDADPSAPDKSYSKIGGWVREYAWDPMKWHLAIPPRVVEGMDDAQKWAIACTRQALEDYGYPKRAFDPNRTAVILGNAMSGEKHYLTALRVYFPEYARELEESSTFAALPVSVRADITRELHERIGKRLPEITEDTMPGELANCIAGRIANLFNFHGPNYVVDAACASAMAAISSATEGLLENDFDVAVTGGIDRNMGASTYIKFCKIGALSGTGSRPYAEGADGFVMGEGAAIFLLKRLADAERDGDKVYAVLRGMGASSDGKGKGITAPNPTGQKLCMERAWQNAGLSPATVGYMEGHGTSTRVGDVVEVESMSEVLSNFHLAVGSVALGSVKSNFGHLKGAAGAAGLLKTVLALHEKVLPPSVHCEQPNPGIDFAHSPLAVNRELKPWTVAPDSTRRAGVSAFGFGGTNFHMVLEEYLPHKLTGNGKRSVALSHTPETSGSSMMHAESSQEPNRGFTCKAPLRGALVLGGENEAALIERLRSIHKDAQAGRALAPAPPAENDLHARERLAIDYADAAELADKSGKALAAMNANQPAMWKALRAAGVFRGHGPAPKVAFLYTGQGSQYANMLRPLLQAEPIVAEIFAEADRVMKPLLGKPLTDFIFVDATDAAAVAKAEDDLRQTAITQPAVLATDMALTRLLAAYGIKPDFTMGHSLGEYGALVAAGALPFEEALEAVSARGRGMTHVAVKDNGKMAAIFAPMQEIERLLKQVDGYVVIANVNSNGQAVIGGATKAVEQALEVFQKAGYEPVELPVSHAFHTSIVAPASEPLRLELRRLHLQSPQLPIVANVDGEFYPMGADVVPQMVDILARQVASPVQFLKGLHTLYAAGARVFVEVGPKKALQGFAEDVLGGNGDVLSVFTNHPKFGDIPSFNQALCGLYAMGLGRGTVEQKIGSEVKSATSVPAAQQIPHSPATPSQALSTEQYGELGHMFADVLERGWEIYRGKEPRASEPVVISGAALGLPGTEHVFDDTNIARILRGEQFIDAIPARIRQAMLDKNITRLVKSDNGGPTFERINSVDEVIKLAGRSGIFDLEKEFGVSADRVAALDSTTRLAMAAGIDALRDAGIPLIMRYKTTSKGTQLPDRWGLPDELRDDTGVIFASAFPGFDSFAEQMSHYYADRARREQLSMLEGLLARAVESNGHSIAVQDMKRRIEELRSTIEKEPYVFDRRFLFRVLAMGHSQFAEFIGARGPNTQINAACASTTQALALAQDWIYAGRCHRVIVISADNATSDNMMEWIGAGFLASGAAATDESVEEAAIPFDRRRHGLLVGMGAAALVVESAKAARERGIQPICEVLGASTCNSAFHGTRLDVQHIGQVMENLIAQAEARCGISRHQIAPKTVFVSHETYTPARGGSASAEIYALRRVFGEVADQIIIANTKGFTGHAMGTGIEDVVAVKTLETTCVPPVANFKEIDPELGSLNLSKGGAYPVEYALRLAAGFGSQISMSLLRWVPTKDGVHRAPNALGYAYRVVDSAAWNKWLNRVSGYPAAELEVVCRTLRVRDQGAAAKPVGATHTTVAATAKPVPVTATLPATAPVAVKEKKPAASVAVEAARPAGKAAEPVTAPVKSAASATLTSATLAGDSVKERILALVAEKTGYPVDMLDLDLDLEADLGVDTVKQAEVFATIRSAYGIARDDTVKLRNFPTLAHVIGFVHERRPDLVEGAVAPRAESAKGTEVREAVAMSAPEKTPIVASPAVAAATPTSQTEGDVRERILALVVEKTGYPKDMLDLDLDLEADLGVDTVKQAEMFAAIRQIYDIPRDENRKLREYPTLAHVIRFVMEARPDLAGAQKQPAPVAQISIPQAAAEQPSVTQVPATSATDDEIKDKVLAIVAEKTGYPKEMLDLDLDLEADLGIDTVKQAEMFASVRATFGIQRDANLKLREFPTLAHVIKFAHDRRPETKQLGVATTAPGKEEGARVIASVSAAAKLPVVARPASMSFEAADRIPRRVPVAVPRPPLAMCKRTGVALGPGRRIVVMPDQNGVANALCARLLKRNVEVLRIEGAPNADELSNVLKGWLSTGPIHGVYWLAALDPEGKFSEMNFTIWDEAVRLRLKSLYITMRSLYEQIAPAGTFLVSATQLGGQHGYDERGAVAPLGGAVVGFTKAYKRERPDALVKAVDFEADRKPEQAADLLIEETLRDPGAVEIGYKAGQRWTVGLREEPAVDGNPGLKLDEQTVFLITGAAGSIVSAITADLAAASGGIFYLLDLVPEPDPQNPDLKRFVSDKENLKRDLFARIQARGERATPALVEKELAALERAHAAQSAIDAVRTAGGTAHYFSVNLTDAEAVAAVIKKVRERSGHLDVLLHAAGLERSHFLPDKDAREFNLVFDVKAHGWFNLLHAIGDMPLGATVAFSSVAGRFGNAGQSDYSSANDLLCKLTSNLRSTRPGTRGIVIDWSAWGGIGMATRGSIPKMMEMAGIDMIPPEAGIPLIRRELTSGGTRGEIVIGQRLGVLLNEFDEAGGIEPALSESSGGKLAAVHGPMVDRIASAGIYTGITVEATLDPKVQGFLRDHQIDGTPVLPGVMGMEAFAEAAVCTLPNWRIEAIEDVNFSAPFKFYRGEPRTVTVTAQICQRGAALVAECPLIGKRTLPNQAEPQLTTHFSGRVRLTREAPAQMSSVKFALPSGCEIEPAEIYGVYFHGPTYQVLERAWWDGHRMVGLMSNRLPDNHTPSQGPTLIAPRVIELCFQTAGLWDLGIQGRLGLPQHIDEVRIVRSPESADGRLYAVVTPNPDNGSFQADVIDTAGNQYVQLIGYRTVTLPQAVNEKALKALQQAMSLEAAVA